MSQFLVTLTFIVNFFVLTAVAEPAKKLPSPHDLLLQMQRNSELLTYTGTIVYSQGGRMETLKIFHTVDEGVRRARLIHLSGEPREIIRKGEQLVCATPSTGVFRLSKEIPAGPFARDYAARFSSTQKPYHLEYNGDTRIAGRLATQITLHPKDRFRHSFKLALDKESQLMLRSLMVDRHGKILERVEYTSFDVGTQISLNNLQPSVLPEQQNQLLATEFKKPFNAHAATESERLWHVALIPDGFKLVQTRHVSKPHINTTRSAISSEASTAANSTDSVNSKERSLMYTDGLTAYSVFVAENVNLGARSKRSGATAAHTVVKEDVVGVYSVTVVGEIPLRAAAQIASSVKRLKR